MNMKWFKINIIALALGLCYTSCSDSDINGDESIDKGLNVQYTVQIIKQASSSMAKTRVYGGISSYLEDSLNNVCFLFFEGKDLTSPLVNYVDVSWNNWQAGTKINGVSPTVGWPFYSYQLFVSTKTTAEFALCIANVPKDMFSTCITLGDVYSTAHAANLSYTCTVDGSGSGLYTSPHSQYPTALPMLDSASTAAGTLNKALSYAHFELIRKVAKVKINLSLGSSFTGTSFKPIEVYMHNVNSFCNWDQTNGFNLVTDAEYISPTGAPYITEHAYLSTGQLTIGTVTPGLSNIHLLTDSFFVMPTNINANSQIIVKGIYTSGAVSDTVYYPIAVGTPVPSNGNLGDGKIEENHYYNINAVINGKGLPKKWIESGPITSSTQILTTIEVKDWTKVNQSQVIN